jgi:hypothetical protein
LDTENIKITTDMLLKGALLFAILDMIFLPVLSRHVRTDFFITIKWNLVLATGLVWFGIWWSVLFYFWEDVYRYVFPAWSRHWIPFVFGLLMAGASLLFWMIAKNSNRIPIILFCLCSGAWGACTHIWAISRGIMTKPPMLQGGSPLAAILIAFFEFTFYWVIITTLAALSGKILLRINKQ